MVESACAVIIADESSLLEVAGAASLQHVVKELRGCSQVHEVLVMTTDAQVRSVAAQLGLQCIEDQALAHAHAEWGSRDAKGERTREATPASAPPVQAAAPVAPFSLETIQLVRVDPTEGVTVSPLRAILEREKHDALLLLNGLKPLVTSMEITRVLQALRGVGSALLTDATVRVWRQLDESLEVVRTDEDCMTDLHAVYAANLRSNDARVRAVPASPEFGWEVTDGTQRVAIAAVMTARQRALRANQLPANVSGLVMDFDGVFTDNAVWLSETGEESVRCNRGDGLGLAMLRARGLPLAVISKERNKVVQARCSKLGIECFHGIDEKLSVLQGWADSKGVPRAQLVYIGNDVNDRECLEWAGCGVVVADAHPDVLDVADVVLSKPGGHGALRELADLLLERVHGYFPVVPVR